MSGSTSQQPTPFAPFRPSSHPNSTQQNSQKNMVSPLYNQLAQFQAPPSSPTTSSSLPFPLAWSPPVDPSPSTMTPSPAPSTSSSNDLFHSFSLSGFDASAAPAAKPALVSHYVRPTSTNNTDSADTPPTITVSTTAASPQPTASRSLRSRFSLNRESPSSTPYTPHHMNRASHLQPTPPSAGALGLVKNPLRRRSGPKPDEIAFAQRMEAKGGLLAGPPPFDPQYLGGVKPPVSMVSLAGTELGWVSVPQEDKPAAVVDLPATPAAGKGKGGPGWYAGKRKNDKGEIVAIGADGVEVVIMKLPVKPVVAEKPQEKKEPLPARLIARTPSPHPPPLGPLPPIPTSASAPAPASQILPSATLAPALAEDLADDLPSTLIREILASSPSRNNEGTGYFDVYKDRISESGSIRHDSICSTTEAAEAAQVKTAKRVSIETAPLEIVKKNAGQTLSTSASSQTIHEEDEHRTPMPLATSTFTTTPSTPPNVIPTRKSSLASSPSSSDFRRSMAFGTRSPPPPASSLARRQSLGADAHLVPGTPAAASKKRYSIVARSVSAASDEEDAPVAAATKRQSAVIPLSPQAWAEHVAAQGQMTWDGRRASLSDSSEGDDRSRRVSTSGSVGSFLSAASGPVQHQDRRHSQSFSSSDHSSSGSGSVPTSSFPLASTPSSYTSASVGDSATSDSNKGAKFATATRVKGLPTSTSAASVNVKAQSQQAAEQDAHTVSALLFALSESTKSLSLTRSENTALRSEVAELRTAIDLIRAAMSESASTMPGQMMSTLNSVASSIFPSVTSGGWEAEAGKVEGGMDDEGEDMEGDEALGEMLLEMPMPPMTVPGVVGAGIRRRGP